MFWRGEVGLSLTRRVCLAANSAEIVNLVSTDPSLASRTSPTSLSDSTRQLYLPVSGTAAAASTF